MTYVIEMPYPDAMAAKNEAEDPAASRTRSPARASMVRSAATLIRERGIHGTGLREVVAHSGRSPRLTRPLLPGRQDAARDRSDRCRAH